MTPPCWLRRAVSECAVKFGFPRRSKDVEAGDDEAMNKDDGILPRPREHGWRATGSWGCGIAQFDHVPHERRTHPRVLPGDEARIQSCRRRRRRGRRGRKTSEALCAQVANCAVRAVAGPITKTVAAGCKTPSRLEMGSGFSHGRCT